MLTTSPVFGMEAEKGGAVYPASFEYFAPSTLDEAFSILDRFGDEAKVLAGGQSLIPLMKLRFAVPAALVDINGIPGLDRLAEDQGQLRIGALVRHRTCERSELLRGRYRTLGDAAPLISDPIVRNLGTVCGSLAHADPQGDWSTALLALGASVEARSSGGTRTILLDELLQGPFTTSLEPTEVITEVRVPDPGPWASGTYLKLERKVGDFATVGVGVHLAFQDGRVRRAGIALTAVGPNSLRATEAEQALVGAELDDDAIRGAAELTAAAAQPRSDTRGSAEYKRNVVRVFTERALRTVAESVSGRPVAASAGPSTARPPKEADTADDRCPNCGAELPSELGQHAQAPAAGVVTCPSCGATATLSRPGAQTGATEPVGTGAAVPTSAPTPAEEGEESFSGQETIAGVMDEVRDKEGG
jgi:aerobic carbon-monoxide dehydrogenase medium subunit